jgi:ubiquinone/menaquinone biosynthesis C-methylase UbiE
LPFDDASVGAVVSVIKKVENFGDQLVAEISRVLKTGGIVLVQSFTPSSGEKVTQGTLVAHTCCLGMLT